MPDLLAEARAEIREKLDWDGSSQIVLSREHAEAILAGPTEPVAVLDEIMRLAAMLTKEQVQNYAEDGGMPSDEVRICTSGKRIPIGKRCPHCGAKPAGEECRL